MPDERHQDCDRCGERFVGENAIRSYLREVTSDIGEETKTVCASCLRDLSMDRFCTAVVDDRRCRNYRDENNAFCRAHRDTKGI